MLQRGWGRSKGQYEQKNKQGSTLLTVLGQAVKVERVPWG